MKVLYFAWLRQRIGHAQERIEGTNDLHTVADLIEHLRQKGEGYIAAFENLNVVKVAVNQDFADFGTPISDNDEIAFFPPVTGG